MPRNGLAFGVDFGLGIFRPQGEGQNAMGTISTAVSFRLGGLGLSFQEAFDATVSWLAFIPPRFPQHPMAHILAKKRKRKKKREKEKRETEK